MIDTLTGAETCPICKAALAGESAFCRVYEGELRRVLCRPRCARAFLLTREDSNSEERWQGNAVEEILAGWRWRELGK